MLKDGQTYFRRLAVFTPQDLLMFDHFLKLRMKASTPFVPMLPFISMLSSN